MGAELTEANTEDAEDAPATESATSETETTSETAPATIVESAAAPVPEISAPESAPETVVAAEGTTGVEAKLSEPTPASEATDSKVEENSGFLQGDASEQKAQ